MCIQVNKRRSQHVKKNGNVFVVAGWKKCKKIPHPISRMRYSINKGDYLRAVLALLFFCLNIGQSLQKSKHAINSPHLAFFSLAIDNHFFRSAPVKGFSLFILPPYKSLLKEGHGFPWPTFTKLNTCLRSAWEKCRPMRPVL